MPVLEERGLFWLSSEVLLERQFAPENSISGALSISDEGRIDLELDGYFSNPQEQYGALTEVGTPLTGNICGVLKSSGRRVVLADVTHAGGQFSTGGMSFQRFLAADCLVSDGHLLVRRSSLEFEALTVDMAGFEEWFWLNSIHVSPSNGRLSVEYNRPAVPTYDVVDGTIEIDFGLDARLGHGPSGISVKETASIRFALQHPETLEHLRDRFRFLEDLMILLTNSEHRLDWPTVKLNNDFSARWYFAKFKGPRSPDKPLRYLSYFPAVRDRFGAIWLTWRSKREKFGPGFYLYLGTRRGMSVYAENRFANLIWGIESFHRTKYPDDPTSMEARIDNIIKQVEGKADKELLAWRLKYAHEPKLSDRIFAVFDDLEVGITKRRLRKFAEACASTRNDISHFGTHRHVGDYSEFIRQLDKKSDALATLYHCLLLREIEIPNEILNDWIYRGSEAFAIKRNLIEVGLLDENALKSTEPEFPH